MSSIFPNPNLADDDEYGLLVCGGTYDVPILLDAYSHGIFPWPNDFFDEIPWCCPNPRFVIFQDSFHVPKSLERIIRKNEFKITINEAFERVMRHCSSVPRKRESDEEEPGTWITEDMIKGYVQLHKAGYAMSVEAWLNGKLVGGLYGVKINNIFCGESMFSLVSNASKVAFVTFARKLFNEGCILIDCQQETEHMKRFGGINIPRQKYLELITH